VVKDITKVSDSALVRHCHAAPLFFVGFALLSGCAMTGKSMDKAAADPSLVTYSLPEGPQVSEEQISDETTIRNAVSSANLGVLGPKPLAWANQDTGSSGAVSQIAEAKEDGRLCRKFKTSRESFEGIALFAGKACLEDSGEWAMSSFGAL
jgi:17 kDa outer membrane surface antigen